MTHLDDAALDAIEQRADAAMSVTGDGPLELRLGHSLDLDATTYDVTGDGNTYAICIAEETAELLIHARTDIPALLAAVREAQQRAEQAESAVARVRELADVTGWHVYESRDTGDVYPAQSVQDLVADIRRALDGGQQEAT